ncbi:metal-dependent transcriptional regulator [Candidatus Micrarchaeota archaeon]|nr:metal-dependent transcriptional regulator [Candidatus Micrarchaeota archaeon]
MERESISHEVEEYLESIYRRKERGDAAKTSDIAEELKVSAPSVSEMFRKLAKAGLIEHTPYAGAVLTKRGEVIGKNVIKKHRLIEKFLAVIGVKRKVHEEACALEHAVSDDVEKSIRKAILKAKLEGVPLSVLDNGDKAKIIAIDAGAKESQRLADMGLTKGTEITFTKSAPLKGAVEIKVRGTKLAIGRQVAAKIFVEVKK